MKNEIIKVEHVKPIREKLWKFYLQINTDVCVKTIFFEKKTKESLVEIFEIICTVAVHCWYIKDAFAGFCRQIFEKKIQKTF